MVTNKVLIKGGTLTLGNDQSYPEERRGPPVAVASFYMDATEVTNRQFAEFVTATGYKTIAERGFRGDAHVPVAQQMPSAAQLYIVPAHVSEMFSTHPATEKRIAALQDMAGDYAPPAPAPASSRRSALDPLG